MNTEQERAKFEAFASKHGLCVTEYGDLYCSHVVAWMWKAWQAALSAKSVPTLSDDEFSALVRCEQTMIDDNSYDIDATMMQKLADYGAVWHKGDGFYQITKFGNYLLKTKNGSITTAPPAPTDVERVLELEKDAERYRWLCKNKFVRWSDIVGFNFDADTGTDEAIDAAMRKEDRQ